MLLDQQTHDRLNEIEATIERLSKAVTFLEETVFPQITVYSTELTEPEASNVRKDKTNETPSKTKPKAKKKTIRKTS